MKKFQRIFILVLMFTVVLSCKTTSNSKESSEIYCEEISTTLPTVTHESSYHIDEMTIDGNCLVLKGYVSGCSEGESILYFNGISTRSIPAQIQFQFLVSNTGECDMIIEKEWKYDLSKLKLKDVVIRLKDTNLEVEYNN